MVHLSEHFFEEENIDISNVLSHSSLPTAVGLIQINKHAENKIVVIPGANYGYTVDELNEASKYFLDADLVITQLELEHDVTFELIEICAVNDVPIILNPAPAIAIPSGILKKVTYLTPNETELEILTGIKVTNIEDAKKAISELLNIGEKHVIATLGIKGALIGDTEGFVHVEGYEVAAVDTVAAGDSFNGPLAVGIVSGQSLPEAVKYANAVGTLTVTKKGAIPYLPSKEDVEAFLRLQN